MLSSALIANQVSILTSVEGGVNCTTTAVWIGLRMRPGSGEALRKLIR